MRSCVLSLAFVTAHLLREDPLRENALRRLLQLGHAEPLQVRPGATLRSPLAPRRAPSPVAALDMNDPDAAAEYAAVMEFDTEQIVDELAASGIPAPPSMNDFDLRSMLVELRLMKAGKGANAKPKAKPTSFGNDFERALYEKPAFKALYDDYMGKRQQNEINLCMEHLVDKEKAKRLYGGTARYAETIARIEEALNAKVEQKIVSGRVAFAGFPANMGENGVRMTLEAFGPVSNFACEASADGMSMSGKAEFADAATAKAAIEKYDGVDMGLGVELAITAQ